MFQINFSLRHSSRHLIYKSKFPGTHTVKIHSFIQEISMTYSWVPSSFLGLRYTVGTCLVEVRKKGEWGKT